MHGLICPKCVYINFFIIKVVCALLLCTCFESYCAFFFLPYKIIDNIWSTCALKKKVFFVWHFFFFFWLMCFFLITLSCLDLNRINAYRMFLLHYRHIIIIIFSYDKKIYRMYIRKVSFFCNTMWKATLFYKEMYLKDYCWGPPEWFTW